MNKCNGCGAILQNINSEEEGYIYDLTKTLCERCFRIKNYNDYKKVEKTNQDFMPIFKKINDTNDLVVLVVDVFCINQNLKKIRKYIKNDIILVFNKRDILPLSVSDEKLLSYSELLELNELETILVSGIKNTNLDSLYELINKYKKTKNVYIVGYTNAGKSTLVNKLIYNYTDIDRTLTTSMLSSTTLNSIEIELNKDLTLIDTPGIIEENNIRDIIETNFLKKIEPRCEIKPKTYQIKAKQSIIIDDIVRIDAEKNNMTIFVANNLKIDRYFKETDKLLDLTKNTIRVKKGEDIVILGLGFIKCTNNEIVTIYTINNVSVYTRKSLI